MNRKRLPYCDLKKISLFVAFLVAIILQSGAQTYVANGTTTGSGNCYTLTANTTSQNGSLWHKNRIDLRYSFNISYSVFLGGNPSGADGMAFVLQRAGVNVRGSSGSGMGYGGISNSVVVEYDTYPNTDWQAFDPNYDHLGLMGNGDYHHNTGGLVSPVVLTNSAGGNVKDNQYHSSRVSWDAFTKQLTVYFDGVEKFNYTSDLVNNFFTGDPAVYFGFTASTGGLSNQHAVCIDASSAFQEYTPPPPITPVIMADGSTSLCAGGSVNLSAPVSKSALHFDGSNFAMAYATSATAMVGALTVEAWVKTDNASATQYFVSKGSDDQTDGQYGLVLVSGVFQFHMWQGGHQGAAGTTLVQAGRWYHVAGTWDGSYTRLYVDGVLEGSAPFSGTLPYNPDVIQIGRLGKDCCPYHVQGDIDELRIWNTARTQSEIQQARNVPLNATPGLVAYYKFDEGSGAVSADAAGGNPANLINSPGWTVSGAAVNYASYVWSNGATTPSINATTTGAYTVTVTDINGSSGTSAAVNVNIGAPTVTITGPTTLCQYGSITLVAQSNATSFSWSNGYNTQSVPVNSPGIYTVTAIDTYGCSATASATVSADITPPPVITAQGPTTFCTGGSVTLTATPGQSYSWNRQDANTFAVSYNIATTQSPVFTQRGIYNVIVTNAFGCSTTSQSVFVDVLPPPTVPFDITVTATNSCSGPNSGSVSLTLQGGNMPYTFTWSGGQVNLYTLSNLGAGTYAVTATDACGISITKSATIAEPPIPNISISVQGGSNTLCAGSAVLLSAPTGYSYIWSRYNNGLPTPQISNTQTYSATTTGDYYVGVTDSYGCFWASNVVRISAPDPIVFEINTNGLSCFGPNHGFANVNLHYGGKPPLTFLGWTDPLGKPLGDSLYINGLAAGTYSAAVRDACGTTVTRTFTITDQPIVTPVITTSGPISFCAGGSVTLAVADDSTAYRYTWHKNNGTQYTDSISNLKSIVASTTGYYWVTIQNQGNICPANSMGINVNVYPAPTAPFDFTIQSKNNCGPGNHGSANVNYQDYSGGTQPYTFVGWTGSNGLSTTNPFLNNLPAGTYTATAKDACGSVVVRSVTIIQTSPPDTAITLSGSPVLCAGGSATLTAAAASTYSWNRYLDSSNQFLNIATTQSLTVTDSGYYYAIIKDASGCTTYTNGRVISLASKFPLILNLYTTGISCNGPKHGFAGANFFGGKQPYTFIGWADSLGNSLGDSLNISGLSRGTYTATVQDACGTRSVKTFSITEPAPVISSITASGPTTFCPGGSVTLTLNESQPDSARIWSKNTNGVYKDSIAFTQSITVTTSGSYFARVVEKNGCISNSSNSIFVNVPASTLLPFTMTLTSGNSCGNNTGTAFMQAMSGGTPPYTFLGWTNGAGFTSTNNFINNLAPGIYTATGRDLCGTVITKSVTIAGGLVPFLISGGGAYCAGGTGVAINLGGSEIGVNYSLTLNAVSTGLVISGTGSAISFSNVTTTGFYGIVGNNPATGCTLGMTGGRSVSVIQYPTVFNVSGDASYCANKPAPTFLLSGSQSGVSYYKYANGVNTGIFFGGFGGPLTFGNNTGGVYTVRAVTNTGGCGINMSGSATIVQNPLPIVAPITAAASSLCAGTTLQLSDATPGGVWLISNPAVATINSTGLVTAVGISGVSAGYQVTDANGCKMTAFKGLVVNPLPAKPTITASGTLNLCAGGLVTLSSSAITGNTWNPGGLTTRSIIVTQGGDYSVKVTDTNSCYAVSNPIHVTNINPPTLSITGPNIVCQNSSVTLVAQSSGTSFTWSNGNTSKSIQISLPGAYTVTAFDTYGCTASAGVTVTADITPQPAITAQGPTSFCSGGSVTLNASPGPSYSWNRQDPNTNVVTYNIANTQSAVITQRGNYTVVVTNVNGCSQTSTPVFVDVLPPPTTPLDIIFTTSNSCNGPNSGSISLTLQGGNKPYTFTWSSGQENLYTLGNLGAGSYSVTATDVCGVSVTKTTTVNPGLTSFALSGGGSYCAGGAGVVINLSGSENGVNYSLLLNGVSMGLVISGTGSGISFSNVTAAGTYSIAGNNASTGCTLGMNGGASVSVIPYPTVFTVSGDGSYCNNTQAPNFGLNGSQNGISYFKFANGVNTGISLNGSGGPLSFGNNTAGVYTVRAVTNTAACGINMSGSATIVENPLPTVAPITAASVSLCVGNTLQLSDVTPGGIWLISNAAIAKINSTGLVTAVAVSDVTATYQVTDINGCIKSVSIGLMVNPLPVKPTIAADGSINFCPGGFVKLSSSSLTGNTWNPGGMTVSSITVTQTGDYSVKVTDANNCSAVSDQLHVNIEDKDPPVPVISTLPSLTITQADIITPPIAGDNCSKGTITATTQDPLTNLFPGSYTIHWTYTDNNGNTTTQLQSVTVIDNTPPALQATLSIIKNNDPGICGAMVTYNLPVASDNVSTIKVNVSEGGGDGAIIFNTPLTNNVSGIYFISSGEYQDIVHGHGVNISVAIELFNPSTNSWTLVQTVQTGTNDYHFGGTSINFPVIPQVSKVRFTASQPVYAAFHFYQMAINLNSIGIVQTAGLPSGSIFPIGSTVNSFNAIDLSGNIATTSFTVTVNDAEKPVIKNYSASSHFADASGTWTGSGTQLTISDNCSSNLLLTEQYLNERGGLFYTGSSNVVQGVVSLSNRTFPVGTNTVTVTVTDAAGNVSAKAIFNVKVIDNTNPVITLAGNISKFADPGVCGAYVKVPLPNVSDNCSVQSVVNSFNGTPNASGRYPVGSTLVTWTVTDGSGNKSSIIQSITVTDNEAPVIINMPMAVIQTNDAGTCGAIVTWAPVKATDNCRVLSFTSDHQSGELFPVGTTTVTFIATDIHNNTSTSSFDITITDNEAPKVITKPVTVTLVNGAAVISAADINNGSTDNCGGVTFSVSKTQFTCADAGINQVTLSVTDTHGNTSTATAVVTVTGEVPVPSILVTPSTAVYTGGIATDIYLGYGSQSVTLAASATGITPTTYSWTGNGTLPCTSCASPVFTPTATGSYAFKVTTVNQYGCSASSTVNICVRDIRVSPVANSKVYVCHTDLLTGVKQNLTLSVNTVANQLTLNPQDVLGTCGMPPCTAVTITAQPDPPVVTTARSVTGETVAAIIEDHLSVTASPNPSSTAFTFVILTARKIPVHIRLIDMAGKSVESRANAPVGTAFRMGEKLMSGVYVAEIIQGRERVVLKLIRQNN